MTARDRQRWDATYRERDADPYPAPHPLLLQATPPLRPGEERRALDLACGLGQNALWLAAQGYQVDAIDISRVALKRAHAEASRRHLNTINLLQADLDEINLNPNAVDLICVFRYLQRDLFPALRAAVRPGGRIVYETFTVRLLDEKPDMNPDYLLQPGELAGYFADWHLLFSAEPRSVAQLIAIKPMP